MSLLRSNVSSSATKSDVHHVKIKDLNPIFTCFLCKGYIIDATITSECSHRFCKSCIIKYIDDETNPNFAKCPSCEVQMHETKPKQSLRPDPAFQDLIFKLIPGLKKKEDERRKEFANSQVNIGGDSRQTPLILSVDSFVQIGLKFHDLSHRSPLKNDENINSKKSSCKNRQFYILCKAGLKILQLKKMIRSKYELDQNIEINFFYKEELLPEDKTIKELALLYSFQKDKHIFFNFVINPAKSDAPYSSNITSKMFALATISAAVSTTTTSTTTTTICTSNSVQPSRNWKYDLLSTKPATANQMPWPYTWKSENTPTNLVPKTLFQNGSPKASMTVSKAPETTTTTHKRSINFCHKSSIPGQKKSKSTFPKKTDSDIQVPVDKNVVIEKNRSTAEITVQKTGNSETPDLFFNQILSKKVEAAKSASLNMKHEPVKIPMEERVARNFVAAGKKDLPPLSNYLPALINSRGINTMASKLRLNGNDKPLPETKISTTPVTSTTAATTLPTTPVTSTNRDSTATPVSATPDSSLVRQSTLNTAIGGENSRGKPIGEKP